ncbi:hypothetical protein SPRG_17104 [Saprolegnia parasitica CBS 223.65]|uniref:Uncharacterized protein n=1 Tax=Saprolegnia parasitica (strain CBS 223.65) TaxID=695850 RepID=A0A067BRY7_SAPPC|nr:hypothetical protein SPRG_17104 [Saprolegnia parasitica CBS 223.65]KDO17437.1 hypothetical protein SPRG_17104 [Saprolegnia parasitica CBS 223.65]|eukprot:XP_012211859.1 hypothetical protein SPRG_17104 [Saprolegnia parasitica CBS 223.65]
MSLFLDAVLRWVEGGNDFHVSYIRGQLQPLLPPGTDVSKLVDAVVAALRQDARLVGRKPSAAPSLGTLTPRANIMEPDTALA